ncbi:glutathione S-transferase [Kushneria sinocarnis]|uniref:Glutathione S-transferase n=1 Tax=Kushneria sinocarnis TaxID=595502 RepID=A0A420WTL2_9GAMM|nr:glutathione S-transferase family protein [Kushneria sinocarnis]RKQ96867.1 glutathione S-transferase [Kushneria sinocarnis]
MSTLVLYGFNDSTYVRTVRMLFAEKGVRYEQVPVDVLGGETHSEAHLARHPFGRVPALETGGRIFYETDAIAEFLEGHYPAPAFFPRHLDDRVDMRQWAAVIHNYLYPTLIGRLVRQRLINPQLGQPVDEAIVEAALPDAHYQFSLLERAINGRTALVAGQLSYADLLLAPIVAHVDRLEEGRALLKEYAGVRGWWEAMQQRESFRHTAPGR